MRPKTYPYGMSNKPRCITTTDHQWYQVRVTAKREGITISEVVRRALHKYLKDSGRDPAVR